MNGLEAAKAFHEAYERLAPSFGYETRKETREFDPTSPNGRLMIAVCTEIVSEIEAGFFKSETAAFKAGFERAMLEAPSRQASTA